MSVSNDSGPAITRRAAKGVPASRCAWSHVDRALVKVVRLVSVVAVRGVNTVQLAAFRRVVEFASHDARQEN